jgi:hypothetical protein
MNKTTTLITCFLVAVLAAAGPGLNLGSDHSTLFQTNGFKSTWALLVADGPEPVPPSRVRTDGPEPVPPVSFMIADGPEPVPPAVLRTDGPEPVPPSQTRTDGPEPVPPVSFMLADGPEPVPPTLVFAA